MKIHRVTWSPPSAADPEPGVFAATQVGTGAGTVLLVEVQPEGKQRMDAQAWVNGARPAPDERLGRDRARA